MKPNDSDIMIFDDYLQGNLSTTERTKFAKKLDTDPDFKQEFEAYKNLTTQIREHYEKELLQKLIAGEPLPTAAPTSTAKTISISKPRGYQLLAVAAVALLLIIPAYNYLFYWDNLVKDFDVPLKVDRKMGIDPISVEEYPTIIATADLQIKDNNLHAAINTLNTIAYLDGNDEATYYYLHAQYQVAICQIKLKDKQAARATLLRMIALDLDYDIATKEATALVKALDSPRLFRLKSPKAH